jgi:PAS domain S-box-containing protein
VLFALAFVTLTVILWRSQRARNLSQLYARTASQVRSYASETEGAYVRVYQALQQLAAMGSPYSRTRIDQWNNDALFYIEAFEGIESVAWVDDTLHIRRIVPLQENRSRLDQRASETLWDDSTLNLWMAITDNEEFQGYLLSTIAIDGVLAPVLADMGEDYVLCLLREDMPIYASPNWGEADESYTIRRTVTLQDTGVLTMVLAPSGAAIRAELRNAARTLMLGCALSLVATGAVFVAQNSRAIASIFQLRYHNLFDVSRDAIFVLDQYGRFQDVNLAATMLSGYTSAELQGMTALALVPSEQGLPDAVRRRIWREGISMELLLRHRDGRDIPIDLVLSPVGESSNNVYVLGIARDITARKRTEVELRSALRRTELLIRELYHRTKNNMQVISSMLMLQAGYLDEPRVTRAFQATQDRIHTMALIYDMLHESQDLSSIRLDEYIRRVVNLVIESYNLPDNQIQIAFELAEISTLIDIAAPCGLIVNEVIANALEHVSPNSRTEHIEVSLCRDGEHEIRLSLSYDGVEMPEAAGPPEVDAFGLQTITLVAEHQLQGQVQVCRELGQGTQYTVRFRDDLYSERV